MNKLKVLFGVLCIYFQSSGMILVSAQSLITFDDLPSRSSFPYTSIPAGYNGLLWSNFLVIDAIDSITPNGGQNGTVSPKNVAFNNYGAPANISSSAPFDLDSAYLTASWNDGLTIEVQGFVGTTLAYDNIYVVTTAAPTLVDFNYLGINEVNFISSGGTQHTGYSSSGTQFVIDNVTVAVPEPSKVGLLTVCLIAMSAVIFRLQAVRTVR
jgi:hypothetical protein